MTKIHIPPTALENGCSAYTAAIYRGNGTQAEFREAIQAAFLAIVENWPGMCFRYRPNDPRGDEPALILPLPTEKTDDKA